jgi:PAS domain S-box-containing protein
MNNILYYKELDQRVSELEKRAEFFQMIADNSFDWKAFHDKEGKIIYLNDAFERITGFRKNDLIRGKISEKDFIHPEDFEYVNLQLQLSQKSVEDIKFRIVRKDKEIRFVSLNSLAVFSKNEFVGTIISIRDITTQKDPNDLQLSDGQAYELKKLQKAVNSLRASIVITDHNGEIEYANPYFTELTGYTREEYLGNNPRVLKTDYHSSAYYKKLWDTILAGHTWEGEFLNRKKNGDNYWEKAIISPVTNDKDKITHFVAIKTDITESKRLRDELLKVKAKIEESEAKYKTAFYTNPDAISITTLNGIYVDINEGLTSFLGYANEEVIGVSSIELNIWANLEDRERLIKALTEYGSVENLEAVFRLKDGSTKTGLMSSTLIIINNEPHILSITRDINDRKIIEDEIKAAKEKAEESDRMKTSFLQNMSHEVRTPLNAIVGFANLITERNYSPDKLKIFSEMITESSDRLIAIITDVIEMSQLQANQIHPELTSIDIESLLNDVVAGFKKRARTENIDLILTKKLLDNGLIIKSDSQKLKRILVHVIDNALKFTSHGSVKVNWDVIQQNVIISVSDTGIGIDKEKQKLIFEPFRQVETESNRHYGGNGLGLALVKAYVELLNGSISIESEIDKGTVVYISLPLNSEDYDSVRNAGDEEINAIVVSKNVKAMKTILIAEDEEINFLYLNEILASVNINILHASNGQEAIDLCRNNEEIDLILMDIKMPVMDGFTAAKLIKADHPEMQIIAQTAYALKSEESTYSTVFDDYLTKPIRRNELEQKLRKYFDHEI